jgi:hypothetical protein
MIKSWGIRWARHVVCIGKMRNAYKMLVSKPEGNTPFGIPRREWESNITMDLKPDVTWTEASGGLL